MKHENPLANDSAIKHAGDSFSTFQAKLKQAMAKGFCVRLAKVRAKRFHATSQDDVAGSKSVWKCKDFSLDFFTVVLNPVVHAAR